MCTSGKQANVNYKFMKIFERCVLHKSTAAMHVRVSVCVCVCCDTANLNSLTTNQAARTSFVAKCLITRGKRGCSFEAKVFGMYKLVNDFSFFKEHEPKLI